MVQQKGALPPTRLSLYMYNVYRAAFALGIVGIILGTCGILILLGTSVLNINGMGVCRRAKRVHLGACGYLGSTLNEEHIVVRLE